MTTSGKRSFIDLDAADTQGATVYLLVKASYWRCRPEAEIADVDFDATKLPAVRDLRT